MADIYKDTLRSELEALRRERVNLRRCISNTRCGDQFEELRRTKAMVQQLRGTEFRWAELHNLLGLEHRLNAPVKINAPVRITPQRAAPVSRTRTVPGYLTKVMVPGR